MKAVFIIICIHFLAVSFASAAETKGLIPEVRMGSGSEYDNERKALSSEIMITRTENKAIESLQSLLKQRKGSPEEADLWYRLAELYMRRSKSGRFFDLHKDTKLLRLSSFPVPVEKGAEAVRRASNIYSKIEKEFPHFDQMDSVLFNNAFASQQLGQIKNAQELYYRLTTKFPKSSLIPDGTLALGELLYDQLKFSQSLEQFNRLVDFPNSRVYSYALYKAAWAYYNMRDSDNATKKLLDVIKTTPLLKEGEVATNRHNLRREALRDLTIFIGDVVPAKEVYTFFAKVTEGDELGQAMLDIAKLYDSHSRFKEMNIFLDEYISKQTNSFAAVKAHLLLVDANEQLKLREKVIDHLGEASRLCQKDSSWRSLQKADTNVEYCDEALHHASNEIAVKWWEIWLKNKQNKEFSNLTERAFKIILDGEDKQKPDSKTRFAYAELLFQQEKFEEASAEYAIVSTQSTDSKIQHDSSYSALFAKEKSIAQSKDKDSVKEAERKALALAYLAKNPNGAQARSVQFKLGHIAYEETNFEEAQKRLTPLANGKENDDFKKKAEDLMLDILNLKKDYAGIQKYSKQILSRPNDNARKDSLNKIFEEANFAEIQEFAKTGDKAQVAQKLSTFSKEHAQSKLSQEAMWQSLSLFYAQGNSCEAAEMSTGYVQKFPEDKRALDALKDAAKSYAECGDLTKSAETFMKVAQLDKKEQANYLELAADMYIVERKTIEARKIYNDLIAQADKKASEKYYAKLLATYKETDRNIEYEKIENKILNQGLEPYTTQILTRRAKDLFNNAKFTQAFELAMKANARDSAPEYRAEARLLQARILERELSGQSVKAREDKFAMVLSMKTEKLDKAQTAYLTALKMSKDDVVQLQALRGIDRSYGNYIESLRSMPLPASLNEQDQKSLRQEIAKIIAPIQEKKNENEAKLKSFAKTQNQGVATDRNFTGLAADKTFSPVVAYPTAAMMKPFYPDGKVLKAPELEKKAKELIGNKESRAQGLYFLSLAAESRSNTEKALWLVEQSLKMNATAAHIVYQKARLLYQIDGINSALPLFEKVLDMQMTSTELQTFAAVKSFSSGDFMTAAEKFSGMKKEDIYTYEVGALYGESFAQKGETDKGLKVITDLLQSRKDNIDLLLEQAHIIEAYKANPADALPVYEKLQKLVKQEEFKDWLVRKINYIKNPTPVVQNVTGG